MNGQIGFFKAFFELQHLCPCTPLRRSSQVRRFHNYNNLKTANLSAPITQIKMQLVGGIRRSQTVTSTNDKSLDLQGFYHSNLTRSLNYIVLSNLKTLYSLTLISQVFLSLYDNRIFRIVLFLFYSLVQKVHSSIGV